MVAARTALSCDVLDAGVVVDDLQLRLAGADHVILHGLTQNGQPGSLQVARCLAGKLLS